MKARRLTRPVKVLTFLASSTTVGASEYCELVPLSERWRPVGHRLRAWGLGVARMLIGLWTRGITVGNAVGKRARAIMQRTVQELTPLLARGYRQMRLASRGTWRRARRVIRHWGRLDRRIRRATAPHDANQEVLRTIAHLTQEVQILQTQIQTQHAMLVHLASCRGDEETDTAWMARAIASVPLGQGQVPPRRSRARALQESRGMNLGVKLQTSGH